MRRTLRLLVVPVLVFSLALFSGACATSEKKAEAPDAKKDAKGTVEVQPSAEELARQQQEDQERQKQSEMEKMKQEEAGKLEPVPTAETAAVSSTGGSFIVNLDRIYFDFDKFEITPPSRETLAKDAETVKANPGAKVVVEGHCDERGTAEYNLALGERRASAAKKYLVSLGVDESRLYTISYGEEKPADAGHNESAWSKNRRVQFSEE